MDINKIINRNGQYGPFHSEGFTNHLPMAQYALYHLKANEEQINEFAVFYMNKFDLEINSIKEDIFDFEKEIGNRTSYDSFVKYYRKKIEIDGIDVVVKSVLNKLELGISSALYHGVIRMSYALTVPDKNEIVRSLAFYTCAYYPEKFEGKKVSFENIEKEITNFIKTREGIFYLEGTVNEKTKALLNGLLEVYNKTGSFIILHTITGLQALISLKDYFDDYSKIFDIFTISAINALLRVREDDYINVKLNNDYSWNEIVKYSHEILNAHTIKLIYSCKKLNELYPNDNLKKAAQIKLFLDHNI